MEIYRLGAGRVLKLLILYSLLLATRAVVLSKGLHCVVTSALGVSWA